MLWSSWPPELLEKEKQQQQSRVLTEKGLEREIKQRTETKKKSNLKMEMINFSGQYGENKRQLKKATRNTRNKIFCENMRRSLQETCN